MSGGTGTSGKQPAKLIITLPAKLGRPFVGLTLSTNSDGAITYSSSNTSIATVDAQTGAVTLVAPGIVTITVNTAGTNDFSPSEEKYKIDIRK